MENVTTERLEAVIEIYRKYIKPEGDSYFVKSVINHFENVSPSITTETKENIVIDLKKYLSSLRNN